MCQIIFSVILREIFIDELNKIVKILCEFMTDELKFYTKI